MRRTTALGAALLVMGCQGDATPPPPRLDVLLITLDTTRADHLPPWGYPRDTAPHLAALAARGAVLDDLRSPIPLTTPAHASLVTGRRPHRHGVRANYGALERLPDAATTPAERLSARGFATGAFVGAYTAGSAGGLAQGFEVFDEPTGPERPAAQVVDAALAWLGKQGDRPWLLWAHVFDAHGPYIPPAEALDALGLDPATRAAAGLAPGARPPEGDVAAYDGELRYADAELGRLLAAATADAARPPLVMVVADHGETLTERPAGFQHGHYLYEEQLRVPGIVAGPDIPGGIRVHAPWTLTDVAPTILGLLGMDVPPDLDGQDRSAELRHPAPAPPVPTGDAVEDAERAALTLSESMPCTLAKGMDCGPEGPLGKLRAARMGRWKLIFTPRPRGAGFELYRLDTDPGETTDLLHAAPGPTATLLRALQEDAEKDPLSKR